MAADLAEVCELFDVQVIPDLAENQDTGETETIYALGQKSELAAGLRGFTMTPYFPSFAELEAFCSRHIARFRKIAEHEDAPAPDATGWDDNGR